MKMWKKVLLWVAIWFLVLIFMVIIGVGKLFLTVLFGWLAYRRFKNYKSSSEKKQRNYCIVFAILACICIPSTLSMENEKNMNLPNSKNEVKAIENNVTKQIKQDYFSKHISKVTGISLEAANSLETMLVDNMKFTKDFQLTHDEMLDGYKDNPKTKGYRGSDPILSNVIIYITDGELTAIRHDNYDMLVDGKVKLTKYDFVIKNEVDLITFARDDVKRFLKDPSSAEFGGYSDWRTAKNPKEIIVQSWVESKNGFGNTVRQNFQLKYTPDGKTLTSVIIGNQECL